MFNKGIFPVLGEWKNMRITFARSGGHASTCFVRAVVSGWPAYGVDLLASMPLSMMNSASRQMAARPRLVAEPECQDQHDLIRIWPGT